MAIGGAEDEQIEQDWCIDFTILNCICIIPEDNKSCIECLHKEVLAESECLHSIPPYAHLFRMLSLPKTSKCMDTMLQLLSFPHKEAIPFIILSI